MPEWNGNRAIRLDNNQVHVWMFRMNTTPAAIEAFFPLLSDDEKQRGKRFVHALHRERFIAAQGFMRNVLGSYLNIQPEAVRYTRKLKGKPILNPLVHDEHLHFNLSHSNEFAMLAISRNLEVGMDVEYVNRKNHWLKLVRRFFTETEQQAFFTLPPDQQQRAFFQVWTRKEAHMKVTGQGLHLSPTQFTVSVPPASPQLLAMNGVPEEQLSRWRMYEIEMPESARAYCACLSVDGHANKLERFVFG